MSIEMPSLLELQLQLRRAVLGAALVGAIRGDGLDPAEVLAAAASVEDPPSISPQRSAASSPKGLPRVSILLTKGALTCAQQKSARRG